jgi:hypothetical protein
MFIEIQTEAGPAVINANFISRFSETDKGSVLIKYTDSTTEEVPANYLTLKNLLKVNSSLTDALGNSFQELS